MNSESWKEEVRKALSNLPKGIKYPTVAKESGVSADRIRGFITRGYLNADDVKKLDGWLVSKGYFTIAGGPVLPETASEDPVSYEIRDLKPFGEIAALIKHLAGVLTNQTFSDKTRITLARNNVEPLLTALAEYEKMLAEPENSKRE